MDFTLNALIGFLTGILSGFGIGGGTLLLLWLTMVRPSSRLGASTSSTSLPAPFRPYGGI